ncbi:MAG: AI-2E family transporter [Chromatiales bacterium]|jgi:predicted PurR-regulated permease PerM
MTELTPEKRRYVDRLLIAAAILGLFIVLGLVFWQVFHVLLVVFAAILFAVFLDGLTRLTRKGTRLPRGASLALVLFGLGLAVAGFSWVAGPRAADQAAELSERLPEAAGQLKAAIEQRGWGRRLLETTPPPEYLVPSSADFLGRISGVFSSALGALVNLGLVLVIGFYLAVDPRPYVDGLTALVPVASRHRAGQVLRSLGRVLRWWLVGRTASMTAVGVLTGIGLWLIDMPLVLALALIAGLLSFVPFIGPIVSAIPAILIALVESPLMAAYVVAVYVVVQLLEGNLITPVIQKRAVSLPPAVLLTAQLLMGVLFGFIGVVLATPLTVVLIVLVQMLYVQDLLGRRVRLLGQHELHEEAREVKEPREGD